MTAATRTGSYGGLIHAGSGTGLGLVQLSVLIPGLLPTVALTAVFTVVTLLPVVVLALAVGLVGAPPYLAWRLATRGRR
jgi:hypothetical protein